MTGGVGPGDGRRRACVEGWGKGLSESPEGGDDVEACGKVLSLVGGAEAGASAR